MGILTADYFVVRNQRLKLEDLYTSDPEGIYWFNHGVNWRAFTAWILGFAFSVPGLVAINPKYSAQIPVGFLHFFYLSFLVGYLISGLAHWGLSVAIPIKGVNQMDDYDSVRRLQSSWG